MNIAAETDTKSSNARSQKISTCPLCSKTFFRKAHMLRHVQQHTGNRPYVCKFCSKTFKRSDVLRDHFSRCEKRGDNPVPKQEDRGRKRHACDPCARLKVKCDSEAPCKKCVDFGRECVRSRGRNSSISESDGQPAVTNELTSSDRSSIGFLLNCATDSFKQTFPESNTANGTPRDPMDEVMGYIPREKNEPGIYGNMFGDIPVTSSSGYELYDSSPFFGADSNLDTFLSSLESGAFEGDSHWHMQLEVDGKIPYRYPNLNYFDWDSLEVRSLDIRQKLSLAANGLRISENPLALNAIYAAVESITARRIESWVKLYFRHWHKHGTFIHEPSFNAATVALPLLLAVMSIGCMYSKDENEVQMMKILLDVIEYYIYTNLGDEYHAGSSVSQFLEDDNPLHQSRMEEFQGAYLMIVVQYWTGDSMARRRARQSRFPRVVSIARQLHGPIAKHEVGFSIQNEQDLRRWIRKESLIRTLNIMIMLDNAFVIFSNLPTRFDWTELDIQFPSEPQYFALLSYDEAYTQSRIPKQRMKVRDAFEKLFVSPDTDSEALGSLKGGNLNVLDLQILIHFLYAFIWRQTFSNPIVNTCSIPISHHLGPLKTAMQNWKSIWDEVKASTPIAEWNEMGFQRAAESYWNLTKAVLFAFEKRSGNLQALLPMESDCEESGAHLKKLLGSGT